MDEENAAPWPVGILAVVQTPFTVEGEIDSPSLNRLVEDVLAARVDGLLVPAVASESAHLSLDERIYLARTVQTVVAGRTPVFWGATSHDVETTVQMAQEARAVGANGCLIAVPAPLYQTQTQIAPFFAQIARQIDLPIMVQDLQFSGPGMDIDVIMDLCESIDLIRYIKIETVPAGPKYTAVESATGGSLHISGGWAVQQMIEALDRGVHAMIPECSMVRIYKEIDFLHRTGQRGAAIDLFHKLAPVLGFANQQLDVSIRFFKRLLVRKGIFHTAVCRLESPDFDEYQERIADELVEYVIALESEVPASDLDRKSKRG